MSFIYLCSLEALPKLAVLHTGVNFTNSLQAAFLYESVFFEAFIYLQFGFVIFGKRMWCKSCS